MKVLDLFSGIGGFTLGLERAGHETLAFCEIEPFAQKVLKQWWPNKMIFKDIVKLNAYLRKALTSLPADSPAKTSALLAKKKGYSIASPPAQPQPVQDSLGRFYKPFAWYDLDTGLWRMWRRFTEDTWEEYSERWPKAGIMRNGIVYRREGSEGGHLRQRFYAVAYPCGERLQGSKQWLQEDKNEGNIHASLFPPLPLRAAPSIHDLPQPYVIGKDDGIPDRAHRIKAIGNSIDPEHAENIGKQL